jgi:hypothetical protein
MSPLKLAVRSFEPNPSEWNVAFTARNQRLLPRKFALNTIFLECTYPTGSSSWVLYVQHLLESMIHRTDVCPHVSVIEPTLRGPGINRRPLCGISTTHCRPACFFHIKKLLIPPTPQATGALLLYAPIHYSARPPDFRER